MQLFHSLTIAASVAITTPWFCSFRIWRFINHLLTYLLTYLLNEMPNSGVKNVRQRSDVPVRWETSTPVRRGRRSAGVNQRGPLHFYRAMHIMLARYGYRKSSVCPSLCPSVTLRYRGHIVWTSSKLITRMISLWSSLLGAATSAI